MSELQTMKLSDGWRIARVGEILKVRNGYAFKSTDYRDEGVPLIRQSNLGDDLVDVSDAKRVDPRFLKELPGFIVENDDLLIGMSGSLGKIARYQNSEPALQNQRTGLLMVKPDNDRKFAKLVLKYVEPQIIAEGKGIAVQNVSAKEIEDCVFPLPPPDDQRRIVAEIEKQFTRLEAGVAALRRVQANLKRYRAAVLKAACEGRLVPTEAELARAEGRPFESGQQLLARILTERRQNWQGRGNFKEPDGPDASEKGRLPDGWTWATFDQIAERVTVGFVGSMKHEYVEHGVPFLRGQNVRENRFDPDGLLYVSEEFHQKLSKSALQPGDLAVVRSGAVGVTCVIPESLPEANCSDLVLIQRPLGFVPQYGAYFMNSLAKRHVAAGKVGVALIHFNTKSVAALAAPPPTPRRTNPHRGGSGAAVERGGGTGSRGHHQPPTRHPPAAGGASKGLCR